MNVHKIPSDGNCLFSSCEFLIGITPGKLRKQVSYILRKYPHLRIADVGVLDWIRNTTNNRSITVDEYADLIGTEGYWGGELELMLISIMYNRCIRVFKYSRGSLSFIREYGSEYADQPIHLLFTGGNHYDALTFE